MIHGSGSHRNNTIAHLDSLSIGLVMDWTVFLFSSMI